MEYVCRGPLFYWRGPSPFHFIAVGPENAVDIRERAATVTYGWGMIPVEATIGRVTFTTSLFAKDGDYYLPVRAAVRQALEFNVGDEVEVAFDLVGPQA